MSGSVCENYGPLVEISRKYHRIFHHECYRDMLAYRDLFSVKLRHYGKKSRGFLSFLSQVLNVMHLYSILRTTDKARFENFNLCANPSLEDFHGILVVHPKSRVFFL
jgi:hypothetical protein